MPPIPPIPSCVDVDVDGRCVLLRIDVNSPLDPQTRRIADHARIRRSAPTIGDLASRGARVTVLAHQGDALDYQNLISTQQHADALAAVLGRPVQWVDDVAGPEARRRIAALQNGDVLLLENVRIHGEELSTFERDVALTREQMATTYLVRHLAPLFDLYVNDAFATAHRSTPSMVAFQRLLPSTVGPLVHAEIEGLNRVLVDPARPSVFLLGGLKVSDGFSIIDRVLSDGLADRILTAGVLGELFLLADGRRLGADTERFIASRDLARHVEVASELLVAHPDRISMPTDVAVVHDGERIEIHVDALPADGLLVDIGTATIDAYADEIGAAGTIFANGPVGAYETTGADLGTRRLSVALAAATGVTAIGGGDTVASVGRFADLDDIAYVSTAGGALLRFVSGQALSLFEAYRDAMASGERNQRKPHACVEENL